MTRLLKLSACLTIVAALVGGTTVEAQTAQVSSSSRHNTTTKTLRDITRDAPLPTQLGQAPYAVPNKFHIEKQRAAESEAVSDPVVQRFSGSLAPSVGVNVEGSSDADNSAILGFAIVPPDTEGDVGPNHYVQWINLVSEIFDKSGNVLIGPFPGNDYFAGLGGDCENENSGDPIVLYDEAADRWLVSQFAVDASPYFMCVAISTTSDPTGTYHQYAFDFGTDFPDYPKLAIWGDSYTMTTRDFASGAFYSGLSAVALDRDAMLNGNPATMVRFDNAFGGTTIDGYLPADADDLVTGPALFGGHGDDGNTTFELWELDVDWTNPGVATFTSIPGVSVSAFDGVVPEATQPSPGETLDTHAFFTMHRMHVRDFGTHMSLVANHTVETDPGTAGIRWYEFRDDGSGWTGYQEGTFSPDTDDRWMGSIAMNGNGDISLGYSRSSSTMFPSIYFTGQTADQSGTGILNVAETEIFTGTGAQTASATRWGDYSMMSVDPSDDNTFWYTTEYYETTSGFNFKTRIASLNLDDGGGGNTPPVASFTFSTNDLMVDFTDTSTDSDGTIASWAWDFDDGNLSTTQNPSHTYAAAGTYSVSLTVTDDMGDSDTATQDVTVTEPGGNDPPVAGFTFSCTLLDCEFTDASTDSDGTVVSWDWDFGGDGTSTLQNPSHTFSGNGTYSVMLTVTDDMGDSDTATQDVTVDDGTGVGTMHVHDIVAVPARVSGVRVGQATVTIYDENDNPVADATVEGTFSGDLSGTGSAVTDASGVAVIELAGPSLTRNSVVEFCVDDVTDTLTYDPAQNEDPAFACGEPPPAGDFMHVHDIVAAPARVSGVRVGQATVTIYDENEGPVADATVAGTFSGDLSGTGTAVTNASGIAVIELAEPSLTRNSVVDFCVDDVTDTLTYDANANEDPAFDCAGAGPSAAKGATAANLSTAVFEFELSQNFPNPFYESSLITYQLAEATQVRLKVYNTIGQEVATLVDTYQDSGAHTVAFDASSLSAGIYLYVIEAGDYRETRRMTLLR